MVLELGVSVTFGEKGWVSDWETEVKRFINRIDIILFINLVSSTLVCFLCDDK